MKLKIGVRLYNVSPLTWFACGAVQAICTANSVEFVATSFNDGDHLPNSLHYRGLAVDVRTKDMLQAQSDKVLAALQKTLPPLGYVVVDERADKAHIHIQHFDEWPQVP